MPCLSPGQVPKRRQSKMMREDSAKFHQTWFKPNNSTLLVVGTRRSQNNLLKFAGFLEAGRCSSANCAVPKVAEPEKMWSIRSIAPINMIFGAQLAPPQNDPDAIALQSSSTRSLAEVQLVDQHEFARGQALVLRCARQLLAACGQRPYISISAVQTDKTRN